MKFSNLSKLVSAGAIAASLAIVPLTGPVQAQTQDTAPNSNTNTYNQGTSDVNTTDTNDDFDWGWLGLLGLAGLAGLLPKKRQETVHYTTQDPDVVTRSRSDYR
ncbi:MAG TPA: WGxxGxxG family protein [Stenomitos sp.]